MSDALKPLIGAAASRPLTRDEAEQAFTILFEGEATPAQIGGLLMALRTRGETVGEYAAAAAVMRAKCHKVRAPEGAMDIVGTGGDGKGTLNISTATAFVVAGAGVPVAKHGNRNLSSKSGAADALGQMGVKVMVSASTVEAALAQTVIRTRVAGTVLRRLAEPGDVVQAGRGIVELARDGDLLVVAQVDERNLDRLAEGQSALVSADAFPSQRLPARVVFIAPAVDPQTGTVEVRVEVPEPPATLRQDMTVSIDIEVGRRERALLLPIDAVDAGAGAGAPTVLVVREGRVQRVPVTLGLRGIDRVEVLGGVIEGDAALPLAGAPAEGARVRVASAE